MDSTQQFPLWLVVHGIGA